MKTLASLLLCAALLTGCATTTGNVSTDARGRVTNAVAKEVFNAVLSFAMNEGVSYMTGQNGQDAAAGAFQAATGLVSSASIGRIVDAYAGPQVGIVAQQQFAAANPQTPADKALIANVIGAALQQAANQLAK